jgi:hypothetical protein
LERQGVEQSLKIFGKSVVVIARPGLRGLSESSAVIRNDAESSLNQRQDLRFPTTATERSAMNKHNRFALAIVLVVEANLLIVSGWKCDVRHV